MHIFTVLPALEISELKIAVFFPEIKNNQMKSKNKKEQIYGNKSFG